MSFRALVVPEDPTNNGYILKPLVERLLCECGRPNARVVVLTNPRVSGYEHAKGLLRSEIIERYSHIDLILFLPDADGEDRAAEFTDLENQANVQGTRMLCCAAVQEVEVWLLAGHRTKLSIGWRDVRADQWVKENVFDQFLAEHGDSRRAGGGRDLLMQETLRNYRGLLEVCPELQELDRRVREILSLE
ncbi:MAG: hypothetical protein KJ749_06175 [Planctomycetes bacterium]|nr:hypothetical protein [Planctomycetota bacterium]